MNDPGSIWVDGSELHFVDGDGDEWKYNGEEAIDFSLAPNMVKTAVLTPGSIWIEGEDLYYVGDDDTIRKTPTNLKETSVSGIKGSVWIESNKITYVDEDRNVRVAGIEDDNSRDDPAHDDHTDNSHEDHVDSHTDSGGDHTNQWDYSWGGSKYYADHTDVGSNHTDDHTHRIKYDHDDSHSDTPHDDYKDHANQPK